ncbi:tolA family protein [Pluralibacter gergoviae]
MINKQLLLAILICAGASGCTPLAPSGCHKTTALGSCSSGKWDDQDAWGAQARAIRSAINAQLRDPEAWKGKKCTLHLQFAEDGTATSISTSRGNKAYCAAILSAAQKARFPAFSNKEVYRDFQQSRFEMGS